MKKITAFLLCALLALSLAACGSSADPAPAVTAAPEVTAAPATEAPAAPAATEAPAPTEVPAEEADPAAEAREIVLSLKGEPIEALYEILGRPAEPGEYASSCLVQGGQDGVLIYDGFTVYTLVQPDGTETVYDVE